MNIAKTRPWSEVRARYVKLVQESGFNMRGLLKLLDWIHDEGLESEIFAHTSHNTLVISVCSPAQRGENVLYVSWIPKDATVGFRYERLSASTDWVEKTVQECDAVETLREFLAYKFGVYRKAKSPNQTVERTAAAPPSLT